MGWLLRFDPIKATRKKYRCYGCMEMIPVGSRAWEWVSAGRQGVATVRMHWSCGQLAKDYCMECEQGEHGIHEGWMADCEENDQECVVVKEMRGD